jgi:hypothetical protein
VSGVQALVATTVTSSASAPRKRVRKGMARPDTHFVAISAFGRAARGPIREDRARVGRWRGVSA